MTAHIEAGPIVDKYVFNRDTTRFIWRSLMDEGIREARSSSDNGMSGGAPPFFFGPGSVRLSFWYTPASLSCRHEAGARAHPQGDQFAQQFPVVLSHSSLVMMVVSFGLIGGIWLKVLFQLAI